MVVERPDGTRIVEHADRTRITTFWKQGKQELRAPDNETGEEAEYCDITKRFVKVECPGFSTLTFDTEWGSCETVWGNGSRLHTRANGVSVMQRPDGSRLHVGAKGKRRKGLNYLYQCYNSYEGGPLFFVSFVLECLYLYFLGKFFSHFRTPFLLSIKTLCF